MAAVSLGTRPIEAVPRTKMRDPVAAAVALDVVSEATLNDRSLPPADGLVERFGVSKTVMREAIQQLEISGLIRVRQGMAAAVPPEDQWDLRGTPGLLCLSAE